MPSSSDMDRYGTWAVHLHLPVLAVVFPLRRWLQGLLIKEEGEMG